MSALRTFYLLISTQTLSMIGSRLTRVALGIWLYAETGQTTPLLLAAFFGEVPGMLGSSLAGVLVDRWDRRVVMMLADAGQAGGTLLLLASLATGRFQVWHLYAIVLLQGIFAAVQGPAIDASITMLVPEPHRERANAIQQMGFPLAGVVAPVLAGLLYTLLGITGIIIIDMATFVVAMGVVYLLRIPRPPQSHEGQEARGDILRELRGGLRALWQRRPLMLLVLYMAATDFLLNGPLEISIPYLLSVTGNEATMGVLLGAMNLGAFGGATLIAIWGGTRPRMHALLAGLLLSGAMFMLYGLARSPLILGVALLLLMAPLPIGGVMFTSIIQAKAPPDMQGRITGFSAQLGYLGATASFLLVGPLVDRVLEPAVGTPAWRVPGALVGHAPGSGMSLLLVITGALLLAITLAACASPSVRQIESILPDWSTDGDAGGLNTVSAIIPPV